ncbi:DUF814 domain-containing protein [Candidatus Woesearchaeota archaeon]|nr:DUF814 domain-containing protein [Candidatus Woesearchaeota archaeon]
MKVSLDFTKTVEQNAVVYFEKAKKAKKKLEGARQAVARYQHELEKLQKQQLLQQALEQQQQAAVQAPIKKQWYEKFRWFISSEGFLVIGGRDATTNEIVIKKHTDKEDFVFHTDMAGSPFFVIKIKEKYGRPEIKVPDKATLEETAQATACFSRAWKLGLSAMDVFYVKPEQVSKEAEAGEYMAKGSFMIRGKKNYVRFSKFELAVSSVEGRIISGPRASLQSQTKDYIVLIQGKEKPSDIARKIKKRFGGTPDDIIRMLPAGNMDIVKG